jgi:hypothetical protein
MVKATEHLDCFSFSRLSVGDERWWLRAPGLNWFSQRDVAELLNAYKELVLCYEAISMALDAQAAPLISGAAIQTRAAVAAGPPLPAFADARPEPPADADKLPGAAAAGMSSSADAAPPSSAHQAAATSTPSTAADDSSNGSASLLMRAERPGEHAGEDMSRIESNLSAVSVTTNSAAWEAASPVDALPALVLGDSGATAASAHGLREVAGLAERQAAAGQDEGCAASESARQEDARREAASVQASSGVQDSIAEGGLVQAAVTETADQELQSPHGIRGDAGAVGATLQGDGGHALAGPAVASSLAERELLPLEAPQVQEAGAVTADAACLDGTGGDDRMLFFGLDVAGDGEDRLLAGAASGMARSEGQEESLI